MSSSNSSTSVSSSHSVYDSIEISENEGKPKKPTDFPKIKPYDKAIMVFAVITVICVVASIAFLVLSLLDYLPPISTLYPTGGVVFSLIMIALINCCRKSVGKKEGIDMKEYDATHFKPKKKKEGSDAAAQ
jgi:hypothetical protein